MATWTRYTWRSGALAPMVSWSTSADWERTVESAGFDPGDDELEIGVLVYDWGQHKAGSLIVSGLTTNGHPFAITNDIEPDFIEIKLRPVQADGQDWSESDSDEIDAMNRAYFDEIEELAHEMYPTAEIIVEEIEDNESYDVTFPGEANSPVDGPHNPLPALSALMEMAAGVYEGGKWRSLI